MLSERPVPEPMLKLLITACKGSSISNKVLPSLGVALILGLGSTVYLCTICNYVIFMSQYVCVTILCDIFVTICNYVSHIYTYTIHCTYTGGATFTIHPYIHPNHKHVVCFVHIQVFITENVWFC